MKSFEKLKTKLAELLELDQTDLDFGIYRIMNARRDEINRFLESDLLPQVRVVFGDYKSSDKAEMQTELDKALRAWPPPAASSRGGCRRWCVPRPPCTARFSWRPRCRAC